MHFKTTSESWPLAIPFTIARETITTLPLLHLAITHDGVTGHAEAAGVDYQGDTPETLAAEVAAYLDGHTAPPARAQLLTDMRPGGARNAIDCALWDWEAKHQHRRAADIAGLADPRPLVTALSIGIDSPDAMAAIARTQPNAALFKLKLGGKDGHDLARVAAVRAAAPKAEITVDCNEGWSLEQLNTAVPDLLAYGVTLIEQPLAAAVDSALAGYTGSIPLCADESFADITDLPRLALYSAVNIKLDKCGGLTAALAIADAAQAIGKDLFVGCMIGTSLGMAPGFLLGQRCRWVDLDGPLLLAGDRSPAIRYDGTVMHPFGPDVWG
jgi:L-alanine-DL-glutamate epimerase-like enolase superfamily enzyme